MYSLQYHIVWCTKYRKQILRNGVDTDLKEMLQQLAAEYQFRIMSGLQAPVQDLGYGQDPEGEYRQVAVLKASGTEGISMGRAPLESFLLRGHGQ